MAAMPTLFPTPDTTVVKWFGMRGVEMPATTLRAFDAAQVEVVQVDVVPPHVILALTLRVGHVVEEPPDVQVVQGKPNSKRFQNGCVTTRDCSVLWPMAMKEYETTGLPRKPLHVSRLAMYAIGVMNPPL